MSLCVNVLFCYIDLCTCSIYGSKLIELKSNHSLLLSCSFKLLLSSHCTSPSHSSLPSYFSLPSYPSAHFAVRNICAMNKCYVCSSEQAIFVVVMVRARVSVNKLRVFPFVAPWLLYLFGIRIYIYLLVFVERILSKLYHVTYIQRIFNSTSSIKLFRCERQPFTENT